jgi:hypothetical protein
VANSRGNLLNEYRRLAQRNASAVQCVAADQPVILFQLSRAKVVT